MVRRFASPPPRKKRSRSLLGTAKGLLLPMGAIVILFMAAAGSTSTLWEQLTSTTEQDATRPEARLLAQANSPSKGGSATSPQHRQQERMSLSLALAGPTPLGAFSSGASKAPVLDGAFLMASAVTPPSASAPIIVAEVSTKPVDIPLPPANPFRLQAPAPAPAPVVLATREAPPAARATASARRSASLPTPSEKGFFERIFGAGEPQPSTALAYAPMDQGSLSGWGTPAPQKRNLADGKTAIYDISSKTVLMPNGQRLEAHSGLGALMDDPRSMHLKNRGVTPANVYNLRMREALFHGVRAIRMIPVNEGRMFGRDGILAHTYMLGPRGDSNGCVSFRDYDAFLQAFLRGEVTRIAVAETASSALALMASLQ